MKLYTLITLMCVATLTGMQQKEDLENAMRALTRSDSKNITDEMQEMHALVKTTLESGRLQAAFYKQATNNAAFFYNKEKVSNNMITRYYYRHLTNKEKNKATQSLKKYQDILSNSKLQQFAMPNHPALLPDKITDEYVNNLIKQNTKSIENIFMNS